MSKLKMDEVIAHRQPMSLLSSIESCCDDSIIAIVNQDGSSFLANENGDVPAWVGIEYMAQAMGAYAGVRSKRLGKPIEKGFLLGTRKFKAYCEVFAKGQTLKVTATQELLDTSGVSLFRCTIHYENQLLAEGAIKGIQPSSDMKLFL
ncbi:hypothetical protein [Marinibactrum halimedae]|uniref:ApeP family dehydratase n=1 Tax=Marinibactrum halimedae TaxID=1444977 RepID=UPI001E4BAF7A|nr:hypothetical protein [Marinibactrum halimedae]MCD9460442.1 hypothetical protein [Marinibactrum halimedae]